MDAIDLCLLDLKFGEAGSQEGAREERDAVESYCWLIIWMNDERWDTCGNCGLWAVGWDWDLM